MSKKRKDGKGKFVSINNCADHKEKTIQMLNALSEKRGVTRSDIIDDAIWVLFLTMSSDEEIKRMGL